MLHDANEVNRCDDLPPAKHMTYVKPNYRQNSVSVVLIRQIKPNVAISTRHAHLSAAPNITSDASARSVFFVLRVCLCRVFVVSVALHLLTPFVRCLLV